MRFAPRRLAATVVAVAALALALTLPGAAQVEAADGDLAGIDVSHWQGGISWADVVADGVDFAIAKATEGRYSNDDQYAANKEGAEALGLPFTAYHYAHPDRTANDALLEADHFVDVAALGSANLRPVLDLEDHGGFGPRRLRRWVRAWLTEVEARLGVKPIIYTSPSFWKNRMGNSRWFAKHGYLLWIAHWHVPTPRVPAHNWAGRGWTLWQYDDCGQVAGINGCVDLDRLNGTAIDALRIGGGGG
jgi:lysozyme